MAPRIYNYTDVIAFLRDWYTEARQVNYGLSHRSISSAMGLKSSGAFSQILGRRLKLSGTKVNRLLELLKLDRYERRYFRLLVALENAKTPTERERLLVCLESELRKQVKRMPPALHGFYSRWYYTALRALLGIYRFNGDYAEVARHLTPPITAEQARHGVKLLESLGLIARRDDGSFRLTHQSLTMSVGPHPPVLDLSAVLLHLGAEALKRFPPRQREVSTMTIGISEKAYATVRKEIANCRTNILRHVMADKHPDRVYTVIFGAYPLSKRIGKRHR
jgi:uncharacterized protein (TIGR02147 family)